MSRMWPEIRTAAKENRHELILSGHDVSQRIETSGLDNSIFSLVHLNFLNISDTCLETLPDDISKLVNLQSLLLYSNKLNSVTPKISELVKLKMLDLSRNQLTSFETDFSKLTQLLTVNLSSNKIERFPSIGQETRLSVVDLSNNNLSDFPDICHGSHIAEVKLNNNNITAIPDTIGALPSLKTLDLASNQIKTIPAELSDIGKLKEVNLKGNPVSDKRLLKLIDQCRSKQVLDYVRQHCSRRDGAAAGGGRGSRKGKGKQDNSKQHENDKQEPEDQYKYRITVMKDGAFRVPDVRLADCVKSVRPHILCCVVTNLNFDVESFRRFIQMQTRLHDSVCEKRNVATIATHDMDRLPQASCELTFTARTPSELAIQPLGRPRQYTGAQLYAKLQAEAEQLRKEKKRNVYSGIHRFLYLLEGKPVYPCLLDGEGRVISFPPITNSDLTKMSQETRNMLVEVTSSVSQDACRKVLDQLLLDTLVLGVSAEANGLRVHRVRVTDFEGNMKAVYPSRADLVYDSAHSVGITRDN